MRIALFEPDIPQNTGNILRLGACLGIEIDIIEPTGFLFDDRKFKRSSMDYINYVKYKKHIDWERFYNWSIKKKFRLILVTTKTKNSFINYKFKTNDILLFGKETAGVPDYVHDNVNEKITNLLITFIEILKHRSILLESKMVFIT